METNQLPQLENALDKPLGNKVNKNPRIKFIKKIKKTKICFQ